MTCINRIATKLRNGGQAPFFARWLQLTPDDTKVGSGTASGDTQPAFRTNFFYQQTYTRTPVPPIYQILAQTIVFRDARAGVLIVVCRTI